MSGNQRKSHFTKDGYQPLNEGYTPKVTLGTGKVEGGYQPATGQGTSAPPGSVPNQPSSVQPPKK
jgi:hypothetical protein